MRASLWRAWRAPRRDRWEEAKCEEAQGGGYRGHTVLRIRTRRTCGLQCFPRENTSPRATSRFAPSHPSLADSGGRRREIRRLRVWPVSGLAASCAVPSRPDSSDSGIENACAAQQKWIWRRWSLTVAGTAQVERVTRGLFPV